jgi:hypothetical protein
MVSPSTLHAITLRATCPLLSTFLSSHLHSRQGSDKETNNRGSILATSKYFYPRWLRHYATSRKVAGSRPDEINEFFQFT